MAFGTLGGVIQRRRLRMAALVAAAGLLASACGGAGDDAADTVASTIASATDSTTGDSAGSESNVASTESAMAGAPEILQFTSPLVGGGELDAASLSDKPTAFWFWAPT